VLICRAPDATALGVAALARLGAGEGEALGLAEALGATGALGVAGALGAAGVETIVAPAITADEAAERTAAFLSALDLTLGLR
jgi:hypothetical protein